MKTYIKSWGLALCALMLYDEIIVDGDSRSVVCMVYDASPIYAHKRGS
jgi:hypothetical protein